MRNVLLFTCLLVLGASRVATAQTCADYSSYLHSIGLLDTGHRYSTMPLALVDDHALVLSTRGIDVVDLHDPTHPEIIGHVGGMRPRSVAPVGDYAYVVDSNENLQVIDLSDIRQPVSVGRVSTLGSAYLVAVHQNVAYVAVADVGIRLFDLSDPRNPRFMSTFSLTGEIVAIGFDGGFAHVARTAGSSGQLWLLDLENPAAPKISAVWDAHGAIRGFTVRKNRGYVADGFGISILELRYRSQPVLIGRLETLGPPSGIALSGGSVFWMEGGAILRVADTTRPESPRIVGGLETRTLGGSIVTRGHEILASGNGYLEVISLRNPASPMLGHVLTDERIIDMDVIGNRAYLVSRSNLWVVHLDDPASPRIASSLMLDGWITGIDVAGELAHVSSSSGLELVDIKNSAAPVLMDIVATPDPAQDVAAYSGIAYLACGNSDIVVVDTHDPSAAVILGTLTTPGTPRALSLVAPYMYVADWVGMQIVDITTPSNPTIVGEYQSSFTIDVLSDGRRTCVVPAEGGVQVVDVTDPSDPTRISQPTYRSRPHGIAMDGNHLFALYGRACNTLELLATNSQVLGSVASPTDAWSLAVHDDLLFVGDETGLHVFQQPCESVTSVLVSEFSSHTQGGNVHMEWSIEDHTQAKALRLVASTETSNWDVPIQSAGRGRFTATDDSVHLDGHDSATYSLYYDQQGVGWQLLIQRTIPIHRQPQITVLEAPFPNPFNPITTIPFALSRRQQVSLSIHDSHGHRIAQLAKREFADGMHDIVWRGIDDHGISVPSGIYFVQLRTVEGQRSRKLVLVR